ADRRARHRHGAGDRVPAEGDEQRGRLSPGCVHRVASTGLPGRSEAPAGPAAATEAAPRTPTAEPTEPAAAEAAPADPAAEAAHRPAEPADPRPAAPPAAEPAHEDAADHQRRQHPAEVEALTTGGPGCRGGGHLPPADLDHAGGRLLALGEERGAVAAHADGPRAHGAAQLDLLGAGA